MDEKTMVNDVLNDIKASLTTYQEVIAEAENIGLRQAIQQIRNNCENSQYEIFKIAQSKGYYKPSEQATQAQILTVKNELTQQ